MLLATVVLFLHQPTRVALQQLKKGCHYTATSLYYFVYHQLLTSENPVKIDPAVPEVRGTEKRNFN